MSAASVTLRGRAAALRMMVDSCIIDRASGTTTNPDTGAVVPTYAAVYAGKCRLQESVTRSDSANAGEHEFTLLGYVVQLPVDSTVYRVGDRVTITAATLDPALVGRVLAVTSLTAQSHATMRRLVCLEVLA